MSLIYALFHCVLAVACSTAEPKDIPDASMCSVHLRQTHSAGMRAAGRWRREPLKHYQENKCKPQLALLTTTSVTHHQEFPQVDTATLPNYQRFLLVYTQSKTFTAASLSREYVPFRQICFDYCTAPRHSSAQKAH